MSRINTVKKTVIRLDLPFMRLDLRKRAALERIVFKAYAILRSSDARRTRKCMKRSTRELDPFGLFVSVS